jgi:glutaredoxin 2
MADGIGLALYQYDGCGYCMRVKHVIDSLDLAVELRNTLENRVFSDEVFAATGRRTVPVLRIEDEGGAVEWLPESNEIIRFLMERYGTSERG